MIYKKNNMVEATQTLNVIATKLVGVRGCLKKDTRLVGLRERGVDQLDI